MRILVVPEAERGPFSSLGSPIAILRLLFKTIHPFANGAVIESNNINQKRTGTLGAPRILPMV